jgi:Zn-dependent protease with chaperone function
MFQGCFVFPSTKRGTEVFRKMHESDEEYGRVKNDFMASHPTSQERYETLKALTETQNYSDYSYCNTLGKRVHRLLSKKDY